MRPPTVSVIVPVRNGASVLPICLKALQQQDYPPEAWEVIVVDDESTDETCALVESTAADWAAQGNRPVLRLIRQEWRGAGAARNCGVAAAQAAIVLFTDADCEPLPHWIRAMLEPFEDLHITAVAGGYLTRQTSVVAQLAQAEFEDRYRFFSQHATVDAAFTHSAAFRREVFVRIAGFDERMPNNGDDLELSYRLILSGYQILFAPEGRVYHLHPETLGAYIRKKFGRGFWRTLIAKRYPDKLVRDSYTPPLLKVQILLAGLTSVCLFAAPIVHPVWLGIPGLGGLGILLLTTVPFACSLRGSLTLRLVAPLFLLARAAAIGAGILYGLSGRIEHYHTGGRRGSLHAESVGSSPGLSSHSRVLPKERSDFIDRSGPDQSKTDQNRESQDDEIKTHRIASE